jgi:hypothetical protein
LNTGRADRLGFIGWLRRIHGWIGLWGAGLGLLFGISGFLLNHRALMPLPIGRPQESNLQLALPQPAPDSAIAMGAWLQRELRFEAAPTRVREEAARPVAWGDKSLQQPAHWSMLFATPRAVAQVDWWVGNGFVSVRRSDSNFLSTLNNLHKGVGLGAGWVLLADSLAGSIVLLSLSGVLLWTQLNRRRMLGAGIALASLAITVFMVVRAL